MIPGLIILDGPDAVGKTTLANELLCGDQGGYVHLEYYPDRELWRQQYFALYRAMVRMSMGLLTVIDRHWPSELIYSRAFRDGTNMNAEARGWDRVIKRLCGVYVVCAPDPFSAQERHAASCRIEGRSEMYKPSPTILDVAVRYYDWWYGNPFVEVKDYITQTAANGGMNQRNDAILYDIDTMGANLPAVCDRIFSWMQVLQDSQYPPALDKHTPNFLGHVENADVLFVGDVINPKKSGKWPFIDFGASSAYISGVLHDLNFDEGRGLWTNAHATDEHVERLVADYPKLKVIALGTAAHLHLCKKHIAHTVVPHPSYAKRFGKHAEFRGHLELSL